MDNRIASPLGCEAGSAVTKFVVAIAVVVALAVALPAALAFSAIAECPGSDRPGEFDEQQIPADYLALYASAGEQAGLPWSVLAAIGWEETKHGTLQAPGVLSGMNAAGAAGPMQFGIGGKAGNTWGGQPIRRVPPYVGYGVDGNGDGIANVYDPADAIKSAAAYLVEHGGREDLRSALFAYNRADWYVDKVLATAARYEAGIAATDGGTGCASPGATTGAWGGHANGHIPIFELCSIGAGHHLRCDAAAAFASMNVEHTLALGSPIAVTDSYRTYAEQVAVREAKGSLAATPGRSNHGWALALDLDVGGWDGRSFRWLQRHAHRFGWQHPSWARRSGSKPEYWHWEYRGMSSPQEGGAQ